MVNRTRAAQRRRMPCTKPVEGRAPVRGPGQSVNEDSEWQFDYGRKSDGNDAG